ncbi:ATP-dependent DNA helicase [Trichonephila clavata]|uniref:ATP-dependent DNA helicase n=1 Tax=Trichonephila clavata TaxID=2740835 RepID=A0A8X6HRA4_TRICU|nr:ATP-dependent DNA helicase [Trichonephila clavata]
MAEARTTYAHILVWLQETLHVHEVDDFISAEIPNPEEDPELFNCITTQMVHGPCGVINPFSPCMKNGRCTKDIIGFFKRNSNCQGWISTLLPQKTRRWRIFNSYQYSTFRGCS